MFGGSRNEIPTLIYSTVIPMPLSYVAPLPPDETDEYAEESFE